MCPFACICFVERQSQRDLRVAFEQEINDFGLDPAWKNIC